VALKTEGTARARAHEKAEGKKEASVEQALRGCWLHYGRQYAEEELISNRLEAGTA